MASNILVVMTPARHCDQLVEQALDAARVAQEGQGDGTAAVTLVWLMDEDRREHLRECLESRGFVGAGPARDVAALMQETAADEGSRQLEELEARARARGLRVDTRLLRGHLEETVMELVAEHEPDRVYLPVARLGPLLRLFGERAVRRLKKRLGERLITV